MKLLDGSDFQGQALSKSESEILKLCQQHHVLLPCPKLFSVKIDLTLEHLGYMEEYNCDPLSGIVFPLKQLLKFGGSLGAFSTHL